MQIRKIQMHPNCTTMGHSGVLSAVQTLFLVYIYHNLFVFLCQLSAVVAGFLASRLCWLAQGSFLSKLGARTLRSLLNSPQLLSSRGFELGARGSLAVSETR